MEFSIPQCCWADEECEAIVMRRPTFCSTFEEDNSTIQATSTSSDKGDGSADLIPGHPLFKIPPKMYLVRIESEKPSYGKRDQARCPSHRLRRKVQWHESRLSKMKRIITGTILLGRKGKKETVNSVPSRGQRECHENAEEYYEKESLVDLVHPNPKMDEELGKCKNTKGLKTKSSKQTFDENMDTENIPSKSDISICLAKTSWTGKKLREINTEISQDQPSMTAEIVLKPRKRKERLDSEGSIKQENKVIRSSSEERPDDTENKNKDLNIRRVSSHEDFSRVRVLQEINSITAPEEKKAGEAKEGKFRKSSFCMEGMFHNMEELEHERIRSCERFSRAAAPPRGRRNLARRKTKGSKKKRETCGEPSQPKADIPKEGSYISEGGLEAEERNRSPSPGVSSSPPALDISTLHKQMEGSEPITSRGKVMSPEDEAEGPSLEVLISPRNSLVMRLLNTDPSMPPSPPRDHNIRHGNFYSQEKKLAKQINTIKRQLKKYEEGFQKEFGYRPSQADKMANKDIKKLCSDLSRLRTQLKQFREDLIEEQSFAPKELSFLTSLENVPQNGSSNTVKHSKSNKTMEEVLQEVEKRLQEKRQQSGRSSELSEMNRGDLLEEKLAVQKALLYLENVFGRPVAREDRDLVRPLYQRYRSLKRLVVRSSGGKLNNSTGELATILEHEAMEFTTSPSTSFDFGEGTLSAPEGLDFSMAPEHSLSQQDDAQNSSSSSDSLGENLHALSLSQLLEQQKCAREEKKKLRRRLKEFEENFQSVAGRRVQKQDRLIIEGIYANYKQTKAKLRLLDALVAKKSCTKRNSC